MPELSKIIDRMARDFGLTEVAVDGGYMVAERISGDVWRASETHGLAVSGCQGRRVWSFLRGGQTVSVH